MNVMMLSCHCYRLLSGGSPGHSWWCPSAEHPGWSVWRERQSTTVDQWWKIPRGRIPCLRFHIGDQRSRSYGIKPIIILRPEQNANILKHFQNDFIERSIFALWSKFHVCFRGTSWQQVNTASGNDLAPSKREAIIRASFDSYLWSFAFCKSHYLNLLSMEPLRTNPSNIWIQNVLLMKWEFIWENVVWEMAAILAQGILIMSFKNSRLIHHELSGKLW